MIAFILDTDFALATAIVLPILLRLAANATTCSQEKDHRPLQHVRLTKPMACASPGP
jgi:hypothetical protein